MLNIHDYRKAMKQLERHGSLNLGFTPLKREGDFVFPEEIIVEYVRHRMQLIALKYRKLP